MNHTFKTTGLLLGTALFAATSAFAQETETESRQQTVIVTATPIRDSQQAAIQAKREAPNVVDIISADTIGRFPDQNLADSLGRLPGLAIERDQGQARYINFRGAPFRYTAIAFDGIDVPGAQNGRIPRFDSFPSVITSAVEANKAITPDMRVRPFPALSTSRPSAPSTPRASAPRWKPAMASRNSAAGRSTSIMAASAGRTSSSASWSSAPTTAVSRTPTTASWTWKWMPVAS